MRAWVRACICRLMLYEAEPELYSVVLLLTYLICLLLCDILYAILSRFIQLLHHYFSAIRVTCLMLFSLSD